MLKIEQVLTKLFFYVKGFWIGSAEIYITVLHFKRAHGVDYVDQGKSC